ncbi:MAG: N-6 DNA methylase, partial [Methylococcaceae bacterium]
GQFGSAFEYYTPKPIAEGIWNLAKDLGFEGGKVLDPCAGVGIFGATAPLNCVVDAVELDKTSGEINKLVNQGVGVSVTVSPFEKVAAVTGDDEYDVCIGNVPFGDNAARGSNKNLDGKYRKENLQTYFILRSLEKLKPKGLAIFIVPTSIIDNKGAKEENLRVQASYMAEFLGAYRLPSKVFNTASTDVITDVIVFKKYDKDTLEKIQELREQNAETLIDANVQWQPFITGKYFLGEGKRFILGEFVPKDPLDNSQWARDKVINHAPLGEIGAMLRKFPDSRVKWDVLETTETAPIIYQEGDYITQAGQTLQYTQGQWIAVEARNQDVDADLMASNFANPQQAFDTGMTYEQAFAYLEFMQSTSQILSAPSWLVSTVNGLQKNDNASHAKLWNAGIVGMSVADILGERLGSEEGVNFEEEYPKLSAAMLVQCGNAKSLTPKANGQLKTGLQTLAVHCKKGTGFSGLWRGDVAENAPKALTNESMSFDGLLYKNQSQWASIEDAKAIHGADFDPFKTDDYCISADGKNICKADDYYSGNYRKFLERADADIAAATDSTVKDKLLRQKLLAESKLDKIDVKNIGFTLNSPLVSLEDKLAFVQKFVHPQAFINYDKDGKGYVDIDIKIGTNSPYKDKLFNRFGDYMKGGKVSLGGIDGASAKDGLNELRAMVATAETQFGSWVKANGGIMNRIDEKANSIDSLEFKQSNDEDPLSIPNMNPELKLHGYQCAFVRQMGRDFSGINGMAVGLGKTFSALAAVQYAHSTGTKSKTLFVVPNSVLSNWQKEAGRAYENTDDCLYVGLREGKNGKSSVDSKAYDDDLQKVLENKHSKIFVTYESFKKIKMRTETLKEYESYLGISDRNFAPSLDVKEREKAESKKADLMAIFEGKTGAAPFLEDMGIDSIVYDEGHCFPAGTLVDGIPIEKIKVGDFVRSFNHITGEIELSVVTNTMHRLPDVLVRVNLDDGTSIVCTHDHPFFVPNVGYVPAVFLNKCYDSRFNNSKTELSHEMQPMQSRISRIEKSEAIEKWEYILLDGMSENNSHNNSSDIQGLLGMRGEFQVKSYAELEVCDWEGGAFLLQKELFSAMDTQAFRRFESSNEQRCNEGKETISVTEFQLVTDTRGGREEQAGKDCTRFKQGVEIHSSRREWNGDDIATKNACGCATVASGVYCKDGGEKRERDTVPLQNRFSEPTIDDSNRSRRKLTQLFKSERIGQEKRCVSYFAGVESVEILESTSDGRFGGLCPDGYVYDITVEDNHNFFVDGVLVHNCGKNASQTVEAEQAKFLSIAGASGIGLEMQAKSWFIRGKSERGDGILLLTATPLTNSPLEYYSMLSIAKGHKKVNDMMLGIQGADDFMALVCDIESQSDVTIDGIERDKNVFIGLNNVSLLRRSLGLSATIKTAADVGNQVALPDEDAQTTNIDLPDEIVDRLQLYKGAFRYAIDALSEKSPNRGDVNAFNEVSDHFGEPLALIGHPFNLINKMTLLIADPELDKRATFFTINPADKEKAQAAIDEFNKRKIIEKRPRESPYTSPEAVVGKINTKDAETGDVTTILKIHVLAVLQPDGKTIVIDSIDSTTQLRFDDIIDKIELDVEVTIPPKLAALLENVQKEQATPRGMDDDGKASPIVKQIVFCDILALHSKIKRLLAKKAGISSSKIAIITGKINNTPEEIMQVQDGFNAHGEENTYNVIIANEKAEVGINLQKGTQAIHHLTIGWTPDSLTQRNGRGVRQGNKTEKVTVYTYDADGTFDAVKRTMVGKKADWIESVMAKEGENKVAISGGLSREQQEELIDVVGDKAAMSKIQERVAAKEAASRAETNRGKQLVHLDTIKKQSDFVAKNDPIESFVIPKMVRIWAMSFQIQGIQKKNTSDKISTAAFNKNETIIAQLTDNLNALIAEIEGSVSIKYRDDDYSVSSVLGDYNGSWSVKNTVDDFTRTIRKYTFSVTQGSAIDTEWQADMGMAKSMIEESKAEFETLAKENGAYPKEVAQGMIDGTAFMIGGKPVMDGAFIRAKEKEGEILCTLKHVKSYHGEISFSLYGLFEGKRISDVSYQTRFGTNFILKGTSEYETCLIEAAKLEDDTGFNTYSDINADVSKYRSTAV